MATRSVFRSSIVIPAGTCTGSPTLSKPLTSNHVFSLRVCRVSLALGLALALVWLLGGALLTTKTAQARLVDGSHPLKSSGIGPTVIATVTVGAHPTYIDVNPTTNRIYVAHESSDTVSVIDGANNTVIATVTVGPTPDAVGVNPTTNLIYVGNYGSNTVSVIDGASNTVVTTVTVGSQPSGIGVNPETNRIYVTNFADNTVSVIDGVNNTVITTVTTDLPYVGVTDAGVNPVTNRIYVSKKYGYDMTVIDGVSNTVVATVPMGTFAFFDVAVNPATNRIYAIYGDQAVYVIDGVSNTVVTTIPMGTWPHGVGVNPMTNRIYTTYGTHTVSVIDGASNTGIATADVGVGPWGVAVNPKTHRIYVANYDSNTVSVLQDGGPRYVATTGNDTGNDCLNEANPCATVQHAIDVAQANDQVFIASGLYTESATLNKPVSLLGANRDTTILHAVEGQRVLTVTGATISNSVVISGLTFTGGSADYGGGMLITGTAQPQIRNTIFFSDAASVYGGGLYTQEPLSIITADFISNTSSGSGGGIYATQPLTVTDSRFAGNSASGIYAQNDATILNSDFTHNSTGITTYGQRLTLIDSDFIANASSGVVAGSWPISTEVRVSGGHFISNSGTSLYMDGALEVTGTQFVGNTGYTGGAIRLHSSKDSSIVNARFENNQAGEFGGGVRFDGYYSALVLTDTTFISNSAASGGGVWATTGPVAVFGGRFERNTVQGRGHFEGGGGIMLDGGPSLYVSGTLFLSNTTASDTTANFGGGGVSAARAVLATFNGGRFQGNTSASMSGGLAGAYSLVMTDTEFIDNTAASSCGGAIAYGPAIINGGRFEGNRTVLTSTSQFDLGGGGLCATAGLSMTGTTFISNSTEGYGGAIQFYRLSGQPNHIANTRFVNNAARRDGAAIAIPLLPLPLPDLPHYLSHLTIVDTSSNPRAAISVVSFTLYLSDTIIANHAVGISNTGGTVYEDYNLFFNNITNTIGVTSGGHSLIGDPKFVDPLHGDYHLRFGSAAIDHGVDAGVYTDLDGNPRPKGAGFDIGAYEYQSIRYLWLPLIRKNN